jgi:Beta-ketoacyl synthase, N-terminal domain
VHNPAAGYWGIATGAMTTSSVLCAHDASLGAGLLEALAQVVADDTRTVLLVYDTAYPEPMFSTRPIPDAFGMALVLAPRRSERALAQINVDLTHASADQLADPALESLRKAIPAARGLPMLRSIALAQDDHLAQHRRVVLDYLDDTRLAVSVAPC